MIHFIGAILSMWNGSYQLKCDEFVNVGDNLLKTTITVTIIKKMLQLDKYIV